MTQVVAERPAVSVDELKRAWSAVQAGQFRANTTRPAPQPAGDPQRVRATCPWQPDPTEVVLPVLGCGGSSGATTLAVAIATAAGAGSRVVECSSVTSSGLAAASTAELGAYEGAWCRGSRDHVLLERVIDVLTTAEEIPHPSTPDRPVTLTVLDIGWELGQVLTTPGWIGDFVRDAKHVVLTTTATVPGMRRLEGALDLLGNDHACAAVLGPRRKKWPKNVEHTAGRVTRDLDRQGLLFEIPEEAALAVDGLTGSPLPKPLLSAADQLAQRLLDDSTKGTPQ